MSPGDFRIVTDLYFSFSQSNLNDRGQVAFDAYFADGTQGIFVSNLVAVPEPSTGVLIASLVSLAVISGRRTSR